MGSCFSSRVKDNGKSSVLYDPNLSTSGTHSHSHRTEGEILNSGTVKNFSYEELKIATRNFKSDSVVGEGGFGTVFKGWIDATTLNPSKSNTGQIVAIKRLNQESVQGHREWLTEISYLGQLSHPNLVKLIGYCLEDEHRLLVYEFLPGGSLDHHLFKSKGKFKALPWFLRIKVALDAAKGLAFLHSDPVKVIYRDFKAANILLDSEFNAKLSDFGLARDGPSGESSHVSTRVMGTYGYADPEYMSTGHLTTTSDVYSFGVFLLELLTGKRALDYNLPAKEQNLVKWAQPFLTSKRKVQQIVDSKLKTQYCPDEAVRLASLAVQCISTDPRSRPTMNKVVRVLQQLLDSLEKPKNGELVSKSGGKCEKNGLTDKLCGFLFK